MDKYALPGELLGLRALLMALMAREAIRSGDPAKTIQILQSDSLRMLSEANFDDPTMEPVRPRAVAFVQAVFGNIAIDKTN